MCRHGAVLQQHCGPAALDAALDELIDRPLAVLAKVTAVERAWAN
jgi:hypothetical protein